MSNIRKFVVNIKRVINYTATVEAEYPQDAEQYVIETANAEGNSVYDIEGQGSVSQMSDLVTEAQAISEFKGSYWFDPDFGRKERDVKLAEESKKAAELANVAAKNVSLRDSFYNAAMQLAVDVGLTDESDRLIDLHSMSAERQREFFNYDFYGFTNGLVPVYNCRCHNCEPFHRNNPLWEKLVAFEKQRYSRSTTEFPSSS